MCSPFLIVGNGEFVCEYLTPVSVMTKENTMEKEMQDESYTEK